MTPPSPASFLRRILLVAATAAVSAPAWSAPATPVRIQLFGDSTQWGYVARSDKPVAEPPVVVLQSAMDARFGAGAVIVSERAVPGTTAGQLLDGTDGRNRPWPAEVDADIVVVNHALNDSNEHVPLATYERQIAALHPTVFETPNAITVDWPTPPYVAAMRQVAARQHAPVADVDKWMRAQPDWKSLLSDDGLHPSQAGYREIVLKVLMPTLEPLVAKALRARAKR